MASARGDKPFRWGFATAPLTILVLICIGQAAAVALSDFGPDDSMRSGGPVELVAGMGVKDWLFVAFLASGAVFLWLQRSSVPRFFRSMHVGVSLISLTGLAVIAGVLVPQIENFEDPDERVPSLAGIEDQAVETYLAADKRAADEDQRLRPDDHPVLRGLPTEAALRLKRYRREYEAFRWAEGYFLYHLLHPYGIGMPKVDLPPPILESLERFGERYGPEERENRRIEMTAAFTGRQKTSEIRGLIERNESSFRRAFDVCTALQLNRAYKSAWFATLLGLLGVGVLFNTFRGSPSGATVGRLLSIRKAGFFTVHIGVLTILVGGFISRSATNRGILHLDLGDGATDTYWAYGTSDKQMRMPFALKLDRFARKDWPTLEVGFLGDAFKSRLPEYTLWKGFEKDLDFVKGEAVAPRPRIHLEVRDLSARAHVRTPKFWEAPERDDEKGMGPIAELSVALPAGAARGRGPHGHDAHGHDGEEVAPRTETALLKPDYPERDTLYDPGWKFRLRTHYGPDPADAKRALVPDDAGVIAYLGARVAGAGEVEEKRVPVRVGDEVELAGGYTVAVQEATADFRVDPGGAGEIRDPRPLADQYPRNPGVWVSIRTKDGGEPEKRLLLEALDWVAHGRQDSFRYKELILSIDWDRWTSPGPPRYVLHWGPGGEAQLLGDDGSSKPVDVGPSATPLPLPGTTKIAAAQLLQNALFEKRIEFLAPHIEGPHFDADFYSQDPMGAEVVVTTDPGTEAAREHVVRLAASDEGLANLWSDPDERFWLRFYGNDRALPFEWRSVLSVWEKDGGGKLRAVDTGPEEEREIRVNDYLHHGGYRFFQTNAIAELPTYSGIGVVYDPGIPVVLMGMYLTIVGAMIAFVVRPIVEAVQSRKSARASRRVEVTA